MMNERLDRLYELMPVIYRIRDSEQGYPLRALLQVIGEQVNVVEDDITQLYENWFIETAQDWAVPYIGELVGYRPVHEAGEPDDLATVQGQARNKILIPRREVANTIRYRRRKGTLALLELLANDVAGWPARAVEFYRLLGWTQNLNHQHPERARTVDLRNGNALDLLDGPFDELAHTVDVRPIDNYAWPDHLPGRHNIPSVGLFVWRLKSYSVTHTPANCLEDVGPHCYTFSVLGQDAPLYINPQPESEPTHIAEELNLPTPIRRRALEQQVNDYYGEGKSLAVWAGAWGRYDRRPAAASLGSHHRRPDGSGTICHRVTTLPSTRCADGLSFRPASCRVKMCMSATIMPLAPIWAAASMTVCLPSRRSIRSIAWAKMRPLRGSTDALQQWRQEQPQHAVIELTNSGVFVEQIHVELAADQSLQLRAANRIRPVLRLLDWHTDLPDALDVVMAPGSHFTLDGVLVTGRAVNFRGQKPANGDDVGEQSESICAATVTIRHCTLTPGWGLHNDCEPRRPAEPCLELFNVRARVCIEKSIIGSIQINEDAVRSEPIPVADQRQYHRRHRRPARSHWRTGSAGRPCHLDDPALHRLWYRPGSCARAGGEQHLHKLRQRSAAASWVVCVSAMCRPVVGHRGAITASRTW